MRGPLQGSPPVGRLTRRPDFLAAASGRRFHTERMTVQGRHRPEPGLPPEVVPPAVVAWSRPDPVVGGLGEVRGLNEVRGLRLGLTVTKKVGHATERNRIRRRLREAARRAAGDHLAAPVDVVVVARRDALQAPFDLLIADLARALATVTRPGEPSRGRSGGRKSGGKASGSKSPGSKSPGIKPSGEPSSGDAATHPDPAPTDPAGDTGRESTP